MSKLSHLKKLKSDTWILSSLPEVSLYLNSVPQCTEDVQIDMCHARGLVRLL